MFRFKARRTRRRLGLGGAFLVGAAAVLVPAHARAHFVLVTPDSWMSQDGLGLPEKLGPCGDEGGGTPTGEVATFRAGQTIEVTINEVIPHPGHYRVALAVNNRSELPPEPAVTPSKFDPCASAAVQSPPIFPVLADNVLPHTQAFGGPQTFTVTLPTNVTCTKCTLQVLETMSNHSAPCFYHHCADISIQPEPETATPTSSATPTNSKTPIDAPSQTPTSTATVSPTPAPTQTSTPSSSPTPTATARPCVGDCGDNQSVTLDDLMVGVRIALGELPLGLCPALAPSDETVDELLTAINNAMSGCSMSR